MKKTVLILILMIRIQATMAQGGDNRVQYFLLELKTAKEQIDKYSPANQMYLVNAPKGEEWLQRAVSPYNRAEWMDAEASGMTDAQKKSIIAALDALVVSASKKLPSYKPDSKKFAFGSSEEKNAMMDKLTGKENFIIHKIGLAEQNWQTTKNEYGVPLSQTKSGFVWIRNKESDHSYCRVYQIDVSRNYEGSGYGPIFGGYITDWLCGCP
jgi:hypothetical protein